MTDIESDTAPKGLNEEIIRFISLKKNEPDWLLEWRLKAFRHWLTMKEPHWPNVRFGAIDYQDIIYYSAPKKKEGPKSLAEVDPELVGGDAGLRVRLGLDDASGADLDLPKILNRGHRRLEEEPS